MWPHRTDLFHHLRVALGGWFAQFVGECLVVGMFAAGDGDGRDAAAALDVVRQCAAHVRDIVRRATTASKRSF